MKKSINDTRLYISKIDTDNGIYWVKDAEAREEIENLKNRGRFLSTWDASIGKPISNPGTLPYEYKSGDYYVVSVITEEGVNYRPDGTTYSGDASTIVETEVLDVNDTYFYDGSKWILAHTTDSAIKDVTTLPTSKINPHFIYRVEKTGHEVNGDEFKFYEYFIYNVNTLEWDKIITNIDNYLSSTSTNAVENRVVTEALARKATYDYVDTRFTNEDALDVLMRIEALQPLITENGEILIDENSRIMIN